MISWPVNAGQYRACRDLIAQRCGASPANDAHYLVWLQDNEPRYVVGFDNFAGKTVQLLQATSHTGPIPRQFARAVFKYAFDILQKRIVFGVVDSTNERAIKINQFSGFVEEKRWPGMAKSDGDLILMSLTREQCRWLKELQ